MNDIINNDENYDISFQTESDDSDLDDHTNVIIPNVISMSAIVTYRFHSTSRQHEGYCSDEDTHGTITICGPIHSRKDVYYSCIPVDFFDEKGNLKNMYYYCSPVRCDVSKYNNNKIPYEYYDCCNIHTILKSIKLKKVIKVNM